MPQKQDVLLYWRGESVEEKPGVWKGMNVDVLRKAKLRSKGQKSAKSEIVSAF